MLNDSIPLPHHRDPKVAGPSLSVKPASVRKREQLVAFIDRKMAPHGAVQAVAAFGRVASEAFMRLHDEPGRAWNIGSWTTEHRQRFDVDQRRNDSNAAIDAVAAQMTGIYRRGYAS